MKRFSYSAFRDWKTSKEPSMWRVRRYRRYFMDYPYRYFAFPFKYSGLQGHHWSNAIAMATPIAHKGATAGAKVVATTVIDFLTRA